MTSLSPKKQQLDINPGERQAAAADPMKSVWVGASAGTGKTKVLIDRVLRLMLPRNGLPANSASKPEKILCLTFTKTAAAEMSNRIYNELSKWATMNDTELADALSALTGLPPEDHVMRAARRLFARVLDTPGGLKIMTIHSFCQSVLKRFPVEANLAPHFELMDEQSAVEYLTRCLHDIIAETRSKPESALAQAFSLLAVHLDAALMSDLMSKIMSKRSQLSGILKENGDQGGQAGKTIAAVFDQLAVAAGETEDSVLHAAVAIHPEDEKNLRRALAALLNGSTEDLKKAGQMEPWLASPGHRLGLMSGWRNAFLTDGEIRKRLATKKAQEDYPDVLSVMQREAERLVEIDEKLRAVRLAYLNAALLTVAAEMVGRYERYKNDTDRLDFDDLIIKTCELLADKEMINWVLFKLDEGIDHILVDEAQDTSPAQWRVIRALSSEFFVGTGRNADVQRTLFAVGDEKQSIYSFQGADPAEFTRMQKFFGDRVRQIQPDWEVFLEYSFRSTRTVLDIVDGVFAVDATRQGVVADMTRPVLHLPFRKGHAGLVELWPLIKTQDKKENEPWKMPVDVEAGDNAATRLAKRMAGTIKGWLTSGEMLPSKGRAIRAGDVLILVQSRGALVDTILRALKEEDIPVAGIDRMTLTEEIAVMDLLAVAAFALQTRDDLTLATILKSPLIGLSEDELYTLCYNRQGTLWNQLKSARPDVAAYLFPLVERAGYATPYEFFAEILNTPCFADPVSGRRALQARLGFDIHDPLDELLNSCLHYEQSHTPSLQKFTDWFMRGEAQIKREQDQQNADQVRIMTVHAAKGLQAPIVFLPDTVKKYYDHNKGRVRLLWPTESEDSLDVPLWSPRAEFDAAIYDLHRRAAATRQDEEYRRLLYVALTRAEDRLYICGYHGAKAPRDDCWYRLAEQAFPPEAESHHFMTDEDGVVLDLRRLSHAQEVPPKADKAAAKETEAAFEKLPAWAKSPPRNEPTPPTPLAPSRPEEEEPPVRGPFGQDQNWKFRRGNIVHQILETLPQVPAARRAAALQAYLARTALQMPPAVQKEFAAEILAVLDHPEFAPIFGPGSRAEVPVVGLTGKDLKAPRILSGQIDRLLVTDKEVLVVDYKTNRPPPARAEDVPVIYLKQMAAYKAVLQDIYPGRDIKCALLWTDVPLLMPLPAPMLDLYRP